MLVPGDVAMTMAHEGVLVSRDVAMIMAHEGVLVSRNVANGALYPGKSAGVKQQRRLDVP